MAPFRARLAIPVLGVACALAASPAAGAAPAGDGLPKRLAATTAATLSTVQQGAEGATGHVRVVLDQLPAAEPVASAVEALQKPVGQVSPVLSQVRDAAATETGAIARTASPAPRPESDRSPGAAGAIDSNAALRRGHLAARSAPSAMAGGLLASSPVPSGTEAPPASATSPAQSDSAQSDSDDRAPELPSIPTDGGVAGAAGVALMAIAALVALLSLAARLSGQVFQMSPARWGPAVYLTPIERPG